MRNFITLMLSVIFVGPLSAQSESPNSPPPIRSVPPLGGSDRIANLQQEMFIRSARDGTFEIQRQLAARRAAEEQQRVFYSKVEHFVNLWQTLAVQLNDQRAFDVKLARKVSKAFHDLEKTDGWKVSAAQPDRRLTLGPP